MTPAEYTGRTIEKAVLVALQLPASSRKDVENSLAELQRLAETAGAVVTETVIQRRPAPSAGSFIGEGKAAELSALVREKGLTTVIFDDELKPGQQKYLEEIIGAKIIDRTRLILDIFAQRARSAEGILQVERAQLGYYLPRLSKQGAMLDSQTGGIGTRGPGERKLEVDQRRIRERISALDHHLEEIRLRRALLRKRRTQAQQPVVAIVGYTNAGKSSLLNALSAGADVYADDKLFATLDPTTRQVKLPGGRTVLFSDTVGFIDKLPHALVAAFRATLEEIGTAQCLVQLCDVSDENLQKHVATVCTVLKELGAENIPLITVYNKADLLPAAERRRLAREGRFLVSVKARDGLDELLARIATIVTPKLKTYSLSLPYEKNRLAATVRKWAAVTDEKYSADGVELTIAATPGQWQRIRKLTRP